MHVFEYTCVYVCMYVGLYDTQPRHSLQTPSRPVVVLSIDVECHTTKHNYLYQCLIYVQINVPLYILYLQNDKLLNERNVM